MARMQPRSLRDGWKQAIQESPTFYDELEKSKFLFCKMSNNNICNRHVQYSDASIPSTRILLAHLRFHRQLLEDKPGKNHIRRAKQFLDFLTIECFSNVQISNQKLIIEFLDATMEYLRRESAMKQLPNLSASFLSCLTAFQRGQPGMRVCDAPLLSDAESIWQIAMDNTTPKLALACELSN